MKIDRIGIIANMRKTAAPDVTGRLVARIEEAGREPLLLPEMAASLGRRDLSREGEEIARDSDIIIALGGDGTLLYAARLLGDCDTPILGINIGSLGFLTEVTAGESLDALEGVLEGRFRTEERMMIEVKLVRGGAEAERHRALNDIVITKGALARVLSLRVRVDGEYLTSYLSDGLIIATPTGSTAYSLSAGGPIVAPETRALILTPICPHTLTNRPIILRDDCEVAIEMRSQSEHMMLTVDGQVGIPLAMGDILVFSRSRKSTRLVIWAGLSYFEVLRKKLNWGGRSNSK